MSVNVTDYKVWAYLNSAWVDITSDCITEDIQCDWGISGNGPLDRLAATGQMTFQLNNSTGKYSPNLVGALAGWKRGVPVKLVITYDGEEYIRFRGKVDKIKIQSGAFSASRVNVTVLDWMDYAAKYPLVNPGYAANRTADEALDIIVPSTPIPPQNTDYDEGVNTFPALFDSVTTRTRAYNEFSKLALSELGYIYLRKDKDFGETLVFEGANYRNGLRELSNIPILSTLSGLMLKEDDDNLLLETGDDIILNEAEEFSSDNSMRNLDVSYGDQVINRVTVIAYPKRIDTSAQVLFSLSSALQIGSTETITFRGNYTDPEGGARVNAISDTMIAPVATTDYTANTLADGTGTNITATLTVTPVYGTEGVTYTLYNGSVYAGYVTKLQARGFGVYDYDKTETTAENVASWQEHGFESETVHQKYQRELTRGKIEAEKILDRYKQPHTTINRVSYVANRTHALMAAFLTIDVGDLVEIKEGKTGVDGWYYVQAVDFTIKPGGAIFYSWRLRQHFSLESGLSKIALEVFDNNPASLKTGNFGVDFGSLPEVISQSQRTVSLWFYAFTSPNSSSDALFSIFSDDAGFNISLQLDHQIKYYQKGAAAPGIWTTPDDSYAPLDWYHLCVTRDSSAAANVPIIYVDGTALLLTEAGTQSGATSLETGCAVMLGNIRSVTIDLERPFPGRLWDVRVYNRILTATEAAALAAGTDVTAGMVFQAPCVRTAELDDYDGLELLVPSRDGTPPVDMRVLDNVYGAVGRAVSTGTKTYIDAP